MKRIWPWRAAIAALLIVAAAVFFLFWRWGRSGSGGGKIAATVPAMRKAAPSTMPVSTRPANEWTSERQSAFLQNAQKAVMDLYLLEQAKGHIKVSGCVRGDDGKPLKNAGLVVTRGHWNRGFIPDLAAVAETVITPDGQFEIISDGWFTRSTAWKSVRLRRRAQPSSWTRNCRNNDQFKR